MSRLVVGPFNRVEGDLEVQLDIADGRVASARVNAPMYRGFEAMLTGREPHDALVIVPRICGICSVSQSVAAARAIADAAGVEPPPNGVHVTNLMLACENLADHLSHFYLFFMPDFARAVYADRPWFAAAHERFAPLAGTHARAALAARQRWFELMGTLGGKWPHTQSIQPGGSARAVEAAERLRLLARVRELRAFLEATTFAAPLEEVAALDGEAALARWHAADPQRGDLRPSSRSPRIFSSPRWAAARASRSATVRTARTTARTRCPAVRGTKRRARSAPSTSMRSAKTPRTPGWPATCRCTRATATPSRAPTSPAATPGTRRRAWPAAWPRPARSRGNSPAATR